MSSVLCLFSYHNNPEEVLGMGQCSVLWKASGCKEVGDNRDSFGWKPLTLMQHPLSLLGGLPRW